MTAYIVAFVIGTVLVQMFSPTVDMILFGHLGDSGVVAIRLMAIFFCVVVIWRLWGSVKAWSYPWLVSLGVGILTLPLAYTAGFLFF
jgi:hypothetical protein